MYMPNQKQPLTGASDSDNQSWRWTENCEVTMTLSVRLADDVFNHAWPKQAAGQSAPLRYEWSVIVLCRVSTAAHSSLTIGSVDASRLNMKCLSTLIYLSFHSFTQVLRDVSVVVCVVLVLYSYQESTLLWRPWIPLMKIKLCVINMNSKVMICDIIQYITSRARLEEGNTSGLHRWWVYLILCLWLLKKIITQNDINKIMTLTFLLKCYSIVFTALSIICNKENQELQIMGLAQEDFHTK